MDLLDAIREGETMLREWRGAFYMLGEDVLRMVGPLARHHGGSAVLVVAADYQQHEYWLAKPLGEIRNSLEESTLRLAGIEAGARKDTPVEDVERIRTAIEDSGADVVVAVGGGSTIDAVKVANALASAGGHVRDYYVKGSLSARLGDLEPRPYIAVQTAASSGAENTRVAFVLDDESGEKERINDPRLVPTAAVLDYRTTLSAPRELTQDGGIDSFCHTWEEMLCGARRTVYPRLEELFLLTATLVLEGLPRVLDEPGDLLARKALCIAAGRGSQALMCSAPHPITGEQEWGGTNCGHFHSYQIPQYASHGRLSGILFPYYTVLMARNVEWACATIVEVLRRYGYVEKSAGGLRGRALALAVAEGVCRFYRSIGFPTSLGEVGVPESATEHMAARTRALPPAVLRDMPVPMEAEDVDNFILPTLEAAHAGRINEVPTK